jgi:hypothetical protein
MRFLAEECGVLHVNPDHPFVWSTELGGLIGFHRSHRSWKAAGVNLYQWYEFQGIPLERRNALLHSHGLAPAAYAAKHGLRFNTIVSVGSPERNDLPVLDLLDACERWLIIHDSGWDRLRFLGSLFDGEGNVQEILRGRRGAGKIEVASSPGIEHSRVLHEPRYIEYWRHQGWAEYFRMPPRSPNGRPEGLETAA